jgi:hypothetical protein
MGVLLSNELERIWNETVVAYKVGYICKEAASFSPSVESYLLAKTHPAVPAPTMTKS